MHRRKMNVHLGAGLCVVVEVLILVVGAQTQLPCQPEQIHWSNTTGKRYKCLDCPDCPAGSQPSVPCGSTVKYGTAVHCVGCEPGKTFSEKYNKAQCDACTVCSEGKSVLKNCTLSSNTKCSSQCASGFYLASFVFNCLPCSECCNDGNDEVAVECANQKKKCKVRATSCAKIQTTASQTTRSSHPVTTLKPSSTQLVTGEQSTQSKQSEKADVSTPVFRDLTTPFWPSATTNTAVTTLKPEKEDDKNGPFLTLVVVLGVVVLVICLLLIFAVVRFKGVRKFLKSCWKSRSADLGDDVTMDTVRVQAPGPASASSQQMNDDATLHDLEKNNQDEFDMMCKMLDNGKRSGRWDFESLASKYPAISLEDRKSLRTEFQSQGSPSRLLMSHLQTLHPTLSLRHLAKTLKEIRRNDISVYLTPFLKRESAQVAAQNETNLSRETE